MKKHKRALIIAVLAVFTVAVIAFIWENSVQPVAVSKSRSSRVLDYLKPFLTLFLEENLVTNQFIRKVAHFAEFTVLGTFLSALWYFVLKKRKLTILASLSTGLFVASADEFFQIFNDRGPAIADVALDFSGVLFGTAVLFILIGIRKKIKLNNGQKK